jgi:uncharacterized membrane protein YgcG
MVRTELYTSGGEFKLPDGTEYVGAYHVHINRGAMVGGFHKTEYHDRLTPVNRRAELLVQRIMRQLSDDRTQQAAIKSTYSGTSTPSSSGGSGGSSGSGGY